jgi:hypothetical protein
MFRRAGYTYENTMAMSYFLCANDYLDSEDLSHVRRLFNKFDKKRLVGEKLPAK